MATQTFDPIASCTRMLVFKNFEALCGLEFAALYAIELCRATAQEAYNLCVKRPDIFRQHKKQLLNRLCNPKGMYFAPNGAGILRDINRLYRINLTEEEQCALADMSDYYDALIKPELNRIRTLVNNTVASSETVTKNHGLVITLFNAYLVASICHCITNRVHEITFLQDGRKASAYLRDVMRTGDSTDRTIPIDGSLCQQVQQLLYKITISVLGKEGFNFDLDIIEKTCVKLIDRLINPYNLAIAAAFGGVDLEDMNPNRALIEDHEALVEQVRQRFETQETEQNRQDLKALFESKGWQTKIAS